MYVMYQPLNNTTLIMSCPWNVPLFCQLQFNLPRQYTAQCLGYCIFYHQQSLRLRCSKCCKIFLSDIDIWT